MVTCVGWMILQCIVLWVGVNSARSLYNFHRDCRTLDIAMGSGLLVVAVKTVSLLKDIAR